MTAPSYAYIYNHVYFLVVPRNLFYDPLTKLSELLSPVLTIATFLLKILLHNIFLFQRLLPVPFSLSCTLISYSFAYQVISKFESTSPSSEHDLFYQLIISSFFFLVILATQIFISRIRSILTIRIEF